MNSGNNGGRREIHKDPFFAGSKLDPQMKERFERIAPLLGALYTIEERGDDPREALLLAAYSKGMLFSPSPDAKPNLLEDGEAEEEKEQEEESPGVKAWLKKTVDSFARRPLTFLLAKTALNKWVLGPTALAALSAGGAELYANPEKRAFSQFWIESWETIREAASSAAHLVHNNALLVAGIAAAALALTIPKLKAPSDKFRRFSYAAAALSIPVIANDLVDNAMQGISRFQNLISLSTLSYALAGVAVASFVVSRFAPKTAAKNETGSPTPPTQEMPIEMMPQPIAGGAIPWPTAAEAPEEKEAEGGEEEVGEPEPEEETEEGAEEDRGPLPETEEIPVPLPETEEMEIPGPAGPSAEHDGLFADPDAAYEELIITGPDDDSGGGGSPPAAA